MLVAAWGLNRGKCNLTMRERGRGDLSKEEEEEEEEIARGGDWEIRKILCVWMREGWKRLDLSICVYHERGERERDIKWKY